MASGNTTENKVQSTGAPVAGRAPEGMLTLALIGVLGIGGFIAFALIAALG